MNKVGRLNCTTLNAAVQSFMQTIAHPILFVGGGNMAHAIISGARKAGILDPERVGVIEPNLDRHPLFKNAFTDTADAIHWLRMQDAEDATIILAVKPQKLEAACAPVCEQIAQLPFKPLAISILAGTRIEQIEHALDHKARVIRVMPNTPAQIRKAMSAISPSDEATEQDLELADQLFSSIGKTITVSEDLMNAFTAIAGSGPAYVFYLAEAMIEAALQLGFDKQQAQTIVRQTVAGSASLLDRSPEMPRQLREQVTSKKGTTEAATDVLDDTGFTDAIIRAIHAARHRGIELGK